MTEELYELLMKMNKKNLISILWDALDSKEQWAGRTNTHCILTAMGCEEIEEGKWKVPPIAQIKRDTESNPFL